MHSNSEKVRDRLEGTPQLATSGEKSGIDVQKDIEKGRPIPEKLEGAQRNQEHKWKDHYPSDENKYQGVRINKDKELKAQGIDAHSTSTWDKTKEIASEAKDAVVAGVTKVGETVKGAYDKAADFVTGK